MVKNITPADIGDRELARRSILGFGEMVAVLGRDGVGPGAVVRRPNALGARIPAAADNPWFDAVIVPLDAAPPDDDAELPHCLWTLADRAPGRVELPEIATPFMGVSLDDPRLDLAGGAPNVESTPLLVIGDLNERAYGQVGMFGPLVSAVRDDRVLTHGLRDDGRFVSVALTLDIGDDVGVHYVATEESHRRRGLASRLILSVLAAARARGLRTATLQASPDGLPVWTKLGFRTVASLRGYFRV